MKHWDATQFLGHPDLGPRSPRLYSSDIFSAVPINRVADAVKERPPSRAPSLTFNVESVLLLETPAKRAHLIGLIGVARTMYHVPTIFLAPGPALFHLHRFPDLLAAVDGVACAQYFGEGSSIAIQRRQCHQAATYCPLLGKEPQAITTHRYIGAGDGALIPAPLYREILLVTAEYFKIIQAWSNDQHEPEPAEHVKVWREVVQGVT